MIGQASARARSAVRRRVEAAMTTPVTIKRGDLDALDPATGLVGGIVNASTVYAGNARIKTITGEGTIAIGDGEFDNRQVMISIPWNALPVPRRDDLVIVGNDTVSDPELPGEVYRVMEVQGGSLFGDARRLQCTGWHPSRMWGEQ